jgi:hypothetical protein
MIDGLLGYDWSRLDTHTRALNSKMDIQEQ